MRTPAHAAVVLLAFLLLPPAVRAGELQMGVPFHKSTREWKAVQTAFKKLSDQTGITVKLRSVLPGGKGDSLAEKIRNGQLSGGLIMGNDMAAIHQDALLYATPFTFSSIQQVDHVRQAMDAALLKKMSTGPYTALGMVEGGFAYAMSTAAVATPADWHARKIWVPQSGAFADFLGGLGLKTVVLPPADVSKALKSGAVDTIITPVPLAVIKRWHRNVKNVFDVPLMYTCGVWVLRDEAYNKLATDTERAAVTTCLSTLCADLSVAIRSRNTKVRKVLERYEIKFITPDAAMQKQWSEWAAKSWGLLDEKNKPTTEMHEKLKQHLNAFASEKK